MSSSSQTLFAVGVPLTADPLSWLTPSSPVVHAQKRGIGPFLLAACFTQLLGFFNVVAGLFGLEECLRAGEQGGLAFTLLCGILVSLGIFPLKVMLIPLLDVISILGLHVYDLQKQENRKEHDE